MYNQRPDMIKKKLIEAFKGIYNRSSNMHKQQCEKESDILKHVSRIILK